MQRQADDDACRRLFACQRRDALEIVAAIGVLDDRERDGEGTVRDSDADTPFAVVDAEQRPARRLRIGKRWAGLDWALLVRFVCVPV